MLDADQSRTGEMIENTSTDLWCGTVRHDWTRPQATAVHDTPFTTLLFEAQRIHRRHFAPNEVQKSTLISIKTGGCAEDCGYCSQSAHHQTGLPASKLMPVEEVVAHAREAKARGATRYCMGAAWRAPKARDMDQLSAMVREVKSLGLETCMTLGMLTDSDAHRLADAGLDYYNHNVDTSQEYYREIVTTRCYADRLETLKRVREAGIKVCCGGILGMGEAAQDRLDMLVTLANLDPQPESVPINMLVAIPGTPLEDAPPLDPIDFVRAIATARVMMPCAMLRLSAGRLEMSDETQALCFMAGANSIFAGERLLTTDNPGSRDDRLFARLGLRDMPSPQAGIDD